MGVKGSSANHDPSCQVTPFWSDGQKLYRTDSHGSFCTHKNVIIVCLSSTDVKDKVDKNMGYTYGNTTHKPVVQSHSSLSLEMFTQALNHFSIYVCQWWTGMSDGLCILYGEQIWRKKQWEKNVLLCFFNLFQMKLCFMLNSRPFYDSISKVPKNKEALKTSSLLEKYCVPYCLFPFFI